MYRFVFNWLPVTKEKELAKGSDKPPFLRVSQFPKQCTGIFKASNAWKSMWNKMMEGKAGVKKQNSKNGFDSEKNEHTCTGPAVSREFS